MSADEELLEEVRAKSAELEKVLDEYGDRLRRMRQRNRALEQEIGDFEQALERLRGWFQERT